MHKRARAHVRAAEKYMHDDDKKKAIAHFGRAMHYFGAIEGATAASPAAEAEKKVPPNDTKQQPIFGFIVRQVNKKLDKELGTKTLQTKSRVAYLQSDVRVIACSGDSTFSELRKDQHRHQMWTKELSYTQMLAEHYSTDKVKTAMKDKTKNEYCQSEKAMFTNNWPSMNDKKLDFYACGIETTLFVTEEITGSAALFIRSNDEKGKRVHIVFDMDGVVSDQSQAGSSNELRDFLCDPARKTYELLNSSLGEGGSGIESIEFEKGADASTNVSLITARLMHTAEAMTGVAQRIRDSETPFTDAMSILNANAHIDLARKMIDTNSRIDITEQASTTTMLSRWLDLATASGLIQQDELKAFKTFKSDAHDLDVKYIMIVLRRLLSKREERVPVVCVGKRMFECTDIDELFRPKEESRRHLYDFSNYTPGFGTVTAPNVTGKTTMRQVGCPIQ
jgi:hypothetical protein